jgi:hypothetical protein
MSTAERVYDDRHDHWRGYGHGRRVWHPGWILVMVLGFIFWWPVGLAILAYILWSRSMGCHGGERWEHKMQRMEEKMGRMRERFGGGWGPRSSGNHAFDEYRSETLRRLEEEQREFRDFLDRLRFAKDKSEFDQFMAERRNRPQPDSPQPQS